MVLVGSGVQQQKKRATTGKQRGKATTTTITTTTAEKEQHDIHIIQAGLGLPPFYPTHCHA